MAARFRCEECGQWRNGPPHRTVLNRSVCSACDDKLSAMQVGMLAGGGDVGQSMLMTKSVEAVRRWFRRPR